MSMVVARAIERVGCPAVLYRQQWVLRILIFTRTCIIPASVLCHVALVHLVARPSLRLLLDVPFHGVVHLSVSSLVYEDEVFRGVADAWELVPAIFLILEGRVTVRVAYCIFLIIRTCCESQYGEKAE